MNKVILTGNQTKEWEVRETTNGKKVGSNSIAVRRNYKNNDGNYDTDFINLIAFSNTLDYLNMFSNKGDKIEVIGRWQHRTYKDAQGNTKYVDECIVEEASILSSKKVEEVLTPPSKPEVFNDHRYEDDLPF